MRVDELDLNDNHEEQSENLKETYTEESYAVNREMRKKKRNASVKRKHIFLKTFLVLFCLVGVLLTPVFSIKSISVSGNSYLSKEQIIDASGISKNSNIFIFQTKKAVDGLEELSFVDVAEVKRVFPSGVSISIKECKPVAQVACGQSLFLVIDETGKILDTADNSEKYKVTLINNVTIDEFEVGKKIKVEDTATFEKLLLLSQEIVKNSMSEVVSDIYSKNTDLYVTLNTGVRCNLGNSSNLSYRVKFINEVYKSIPKEKKGRLEFVEEYKAVFTEDEE